MAGLASAEEPAEDPIGNHLVDHGSTSIAAHQLLGLVGIDHRLAPGVWLEFRYGHGRAVSGEGMENKSLLSLKLSPASALGG